MTAPLSLARPQALARYAELRYPDDGPASWGHEYDEADLAAFEQLLAEAGQPLAWAEPAAPAAEEPPEPDSEAQHWEAAAMAWRGASASWKRLVERGDAERQLLQQRIDALLAELAERTEERDAAQDNRDSWRRRFDEVAGERQEALELADEKLTLAKFWLNKFEAAEDELDEVRRKLDDAGDQAERLEAERDAAGDQVEQLTAERDAARQEAANLRRRCDYVAAYLQPWHPMMQMADPHMAAAMLKGVVAVPAQEPRRA